MQPSNTPSPEAIETAAQIAAHTDNLAANIIVCALPLTALALCSLIKRKAPRRACMIAIVIAACFAPRAYSEFSSTAAALFCVAAVLHEYGVARFDARDRRACNPSLKD